MDDIDQVLRLIEVFERRTADADDAATPTPTPTQVLKALDETDFDVYQAFKSVTP